MRVRRTSYTICTEILRVHVAILSPESLFNWQVPQCASPSTDRVDTSALVMRCLPDEVSIEHDIFIPGQVRVSFPCEPTGMQGAILNLCFIHHVCLAMTQQGVRQSITEGSTPWVGYGLPAVLVLPASSCRRYGDQYGRSLSGCLPISG